MRCALRVCAPLIALAVMLGLAGACARTHLNAAANDEAPAAGRSTDPNHAKPGAAAGKPTGGGGTGPADASAVDRGFAGRVAAHDAGSPPDSGEPGLPSEAGSGAHPTGGVQAPSAVAASSANTGAGINAGAGSPAISGDVPQLPVGIEIAEGATLPEGLWVGETRSELACAIEGGGVLPGSSRRVTIQITRPNTDALARGSLVFGDRQEVPPTATNPDEGYPVTDHDRLDPVCRANHASAGYPYQIRDGHVSADGRLDFRIALVELYGTWCALQKGYRGQGPSTFETGYSCVPPLDIYSVCAPEPASCPISAVKYEICSSAAICLCLESGCYANLNRAYRFDVRVQAQTMSGVLASVGLFQSPIEIKLRKVE